MASAAQALANKANAQRSTGPRTDTGKAASSQNARTHGLSSRNFVILPGQEEEFATFSAALKAEFAPEGIYQNVLFDQILLASWNLRRCAAAEAELQRAAEDPTIDPLLVETNEAKLRLILLYAARAERTLARAAKELRLVQTEAAYRAEANLPADIGVLVDTKAVQKHIYTNERTRQQANLATSRAIIEGPTPGQLDRHAAATATAAAAPAAEQSKPTRRFSLSGFFRFA